MDLESAIKELFNVGRVQRGFDNPRKTLFLGLSKLLKELSERELACITEHTCSTCESTLIQRVNLDIDDPFGVFVCLHCKTESDSVKEVEDEEVF